MRLKCERRAYNSDGTLRSICQEQHTATLAYHGGSLNEWWIELRPGVTGISVSDLLKPEHAGHGWFANAGTDGSWPELYVLPDEVERLRDFVRLIQPVLAMIKGGAK